MAEGCASTSSRNHAELERRILVDSREQPSSAWFQNHPHVRAKLDAADYSLEGCEHLVGIERKSGPDLIACVGRERGRFTRMLERWPTSRRAASKSLTPKPSPTSGARL